MRIVVIDDEPALCRALSITLGKLGEVITFTDPQRALEHLSTSRPEVVVCDYRMPVLTGLDVLQRIDRGIPFVLISGDLSLLDEETRRRNVTAFLAKPFRPEELIQTVRTLLDASTA